jgi:hypothetical protein
MIEISLYQPNGDALRIIVKNDAKKNFDIKKYHKLPQTLDT